MHHSSKKQRMPEPTEAPPHSRRSATVTEVPRGGPAHDEIAAAEVGQALEEGGRKMLDVFAEGTEAEVRIGGCGRRRLRVGQEQILPCAACGAKSAPSRRGVPTKRRVCSAEG